MKLKTYILPPLSLLPFLGLAHAEVLYQDSFDNDTLAVNEGIGGGATSISDTSSSWTDDGVATYSNGGNQYFRRALMYSEQSFQSDTGFRLKFKYKTGSVGATAAHNFSFGLVSSDTEPSSLTGFNPFREETGVYSIGANITQVESAATQGLNFTDGSTVTTFDQSGTRAQFKAGETAEVSIEIGVGGYWCYRIDGVYEDSGVLLEGFDLTKDYHVVVYGQDDHGGGKAIESITLETRYALGERANHLRSSWTGGEGLSTVKDLRTLDNVLMGFNGGATASPAHFAPNRLLETLARGDTDENGNPINLIVPSWGDLTSEVPTAVDNRTIYCVSRTLERIL